MKLPARRKKAKRPTGRGPVDCRPHLQWIRGHWCSVKGLECFGNVEAHHVKTRGAGGGDDMTVPLCSFHHARLDSPGWSQKRFEGMYGLDLHAVAARLWGNSPHGIKYRREAEGAA